MFKRLVRKRCCHVYDFSAGSLLVSISRCIPVIYVMVADLVLDRCLRHVWRLLSCTWIHQQEMMRGCLCWLTFLIFVSFGAFWGRFGFWLLAWLRAEGVASGWDGFGDDVRKGA